MREDDQRLGSRANFRLSRRMRRQHLRRPETRMGRARRHLPCSLFLSLPAPGFCRLSCLNPCSGSPSKASEASILCQPCAQGNLTNFLIPQETMKKTSRECYEAVNSLRSRPVFFGRFPNEYRKFVGFSVSDARATRDHGINLYAELRQGSPAHSSQYRSRRDR